MHIFLHRKIDQCHHLQESNSGYSWLVKSTVPRAAGYATMNWIVPITLNALGLGPTGILPRSISASIQYVYGLSSVFSFFQETATTPADVYNSLWSLLKSGLKLVQKRLLQNRGRITECIYYYQSWCFN
ncbi:unnamed protein product [Rotaria magnacalcarata]|uniref:Uncharacterized protein n=1 Tax=Rotaria magnacalcarata TaxID=392030 RepID=A0A819TFN6_9BILA|nr:unnamed protein product [Rotaria magnacalcarata]CAF4079026.1 unnamed protein product [Rotaria magnacalcarata]